LKTGPLPQLDAETVTNEEILNLNALIVIDDAAVGEHSVHVGQDQFDTFAASLELHDASQYLLYPETSELNDDGRSVLATDRQCTELPDAAKPHDFTGASWILG
jgi:hypothetical protein